MRRDSAVALALLATAAVAKIPTLAQPLTENFAWRQTQTAWTALIYHRGGIDLLRPEVPVHGPPWVFGFEFPLFQALGALVMDAGVAPDIAMRLMGLVTFLICGWLVYQLGTKVAGSVAGTVALVAFLFSPFGLLWGRTSLIEYLATACALAFLLLGMRWLDRGGRKELIGAGVMGTLAMLVKITTGAFYLLPILAYRGAARGPGLRDWPIVVVVAVSSIAGRAWIAYTDSLKAASPATVFQTSAGTVTFIFGTIDMRFDPTVWAPIAAALLVGLSGGGLLLWGAMALAQLRRLTQGRFVGALFATVIVLPLLVLTPLYSTQNYYPAALSPAVAILVGLGAEWAWDRRSELVGRAALATGVTAWLITLVAASDYWLDSYRPVVDRDGSLAAADFVRARTEPGDWVVISGRGWDPTVLYYADRRGYALDDRRDDDATIDRLRATGDYALFVECPYEGRCRVIEE